MATEVLSGPRRKAMRLASDVLIVLNYASMLGEGAMPFPLDEPPSTPPPKKKVKHL